MCWCRWCCGMASVQLELFPGRQWSSLSAVLFLGCRWCHFWVASGAVPGSSVVQFLGRQWSGMLAALSMGRQWCCSWVVSGSVSGSSVVLYLGRPACVSDRAVQDECKV